MAAAIGNQYAAKSKQWTMAIERALEVRGAGDRRVALDELAGKLLDKCAEGDLVALKEVGDRLEGKPTAFAEITARRGESLHEEQARLLAESFIESQRRPTLSPAESNTVHDSVPAGLPPR